VGKEEKSALFYFYGWQQLEEAVFVFVLPFNWVIKTKKKNNDND
jgi:hypothetical protein